MPIWTADWYAPCSGEGVGDRFTGGGCGGEHGGVDGVGDKGGDDVSLVWIVRLVLFIVAGCGSGCVSSHIGKLADVSVALGAGLGSSASWSLANLARLASVSTVSGMPLSIQWVTKVTILDIGLSLSVG